MPPERCLKCNHWNFNRAKCDRVLKIKMFIGHGGGDLDIQTQPGLIPEHLEDELTAYLVDAITQAVDSYPGWKEIQGLLDKQVCAAKTENKAFKEFGRTLSLARPVQEPQPEKNLDVHGLFRADISLL